MFKYLVLVAAGLGVMAMHKPLDTRVLSHEGCSQVAQCALANLPAQWQLIQSDRGYEISDATQKLLVRVDAQQTVIVAGEAAGIMKLVDYSSGQQITPTIAEKLARQNGQLRVIYGRGLTAWYRETQRGIEQGFTLSKELNRNSNQVKLVFDIRGHLQVHLRTPRELDFNDAGGRTRLRYAGVFAYDGQHRPLRAWMALAGHALTLSIATRGARYPITVDPLITTVTQFKDPDQVRGDNFGYSLALSGDGSVALIGAFSAGANGSATGKAYIYSQTNGTWNTQPAVTWLDPQGITLDKFGSEVALSANGATAVISAPGSSRVYVYTVSGGTWSATPVAVLPDPAGATQDCFCSVAVSANGTVVLVGAFGTTVNGTSDVGRVYVFAQSNGIWSTSPVAELNDPSAVFGEDFGYALALSADGTAALIGAPHPSGVGRVFLFVAQSGAWGLSPIATLSDPMSNVQDNFGSSLALSSNGTVALVGAYGSDKGSGTAYLYRSTGGVWSATPEASFSDPDAAAGDFFGYSVALSGDATTALIGAPGDQGSGAYGGFEGKAYVFKEMNGQWATTPTGTASLVDPYPIALDGFGTSVALTSTGTIALVGAPQTPGILPVGSPNNTGGPGQAYAFENSNDWGYGTTTSSGGGGAFDWLCSTGLLILSWTGRRRLRR